MCMSSASASGDKRGHEGLQELVAVPHMGLQTRRPLSLPGTRDHEVGTKTPSRTEEEGHSLAAKCHIPVYMHQQPGP